MDSTILLFLAQDGVVNGAIYALMALALVKADAQRCTTKFVSSGGTGGGKQLAFMCREFVKFNFRYGCGRYLRLARAERVWLCESKSFPCEHTIDGRRQL